MSVMRALVKTTAGPGLELIEAPIPRPGPTDVMIKIRKTGVCGTDLHIYNWDAWAAKTIRPPLIVGHEYAGEVVEVGQLVTGFKVGDIVSGEGHLVCGHCRNCLAGRRHLCENTEGVGVNRAGAMADYLVIPAVNAWQPRPAMPLETMAVFDPLGNAVHSALTFDLVGEDVLITGAGAIGLMAAAVCRHVGARYVVALEPNAYRRNLALRAGADLVVDPADGNLKDAMNRLGMVSGFDVGLEMSGHPAAFHQMVDHMFHGGRIALLGILPPEAVIDWNAVIFKSLTIKGIYGREMFETWYKMTAMLASGLDIDPLITHRFPAEEFERAFEVMNSADCGKVILDWD